MVYVIALFAIFVAGYTMLYSHQQKISFYKKYMETAGHEMNAFYTAMMNERETQIMSEEKVKQAIKALATRMVNEAID